MKSFLQYIQETFTDHNDVDHDDAPECSHCGSEYNPKRAALGYKTCLNCGEGKNANVVMLDVNKSTPTITKRVEGLVGTAFAHRHVQSATKSGGHNGFVKLSSGAFETRKDLTKSGHGGSIRASNAGDKSKKF